MISEYPKRFGRRRGRRLRLDDVIKAILKAEAGRTLPNTSMEVPNTTFVMETEATYLPLLLVFGQLQHIKVQRLCFASCFNL